MGKVIIHETAATETARSGSSTKKNSANSQGEHVHVDVSRKAKKASANSTTQKSNRRVVTKTSAAKEVAVVKRSSKISRFATEDKPQIIAREKPAKVVSHDVDKPETGLVLRSRARIVDPEIALMDSRSRAMERTKVDAVKSNWRSMSGMLSERGHTKRYGQSQTDTSRVANATTIETKKAEEEPQFTKAKSALIGVGVALVVAVIGFAGIAIFGNNKEMCTVHFESNGGSEVEGVEFVCGRTISQPEDPVKEGFTFQGWIYEGDPFDFSNGIYKNATLVAKWQADDGVEVVTVKFDTDGGSSISDIEVAKGKTLTEPSAPTKMGYVFLDWYLGDQVFDFSQPVEENITLKAKWERRSSTDSGSNTTSAQSNNRATSVTVSTPKVDLEIGKSTAVTVSVLPSAAEYSLAVTVNNDVVECSVDKNTVSCVAKKAGIATVRVRDVNSGNSSTFTVTVPENDNPPVESGGDDDPPVVIEPEPDPVSYTLTINYVDEAGNVVASQYVQSLVVGTVYNVNSPSVDGYTTSQATVSGTMGQQDAVIQVEYQKDTPVETEPEPGEPSSET